VNAFEQRLNREHFAESIFIATRDIDIANLSVRLSDRLPVRLSVRDVSVSDENGLTYRHSYFHHTVAQSFEFYQHQTFSQNFYGVTPCEAAKYRFGIKISRSRKRYKISHSYYESRIGTRVRSIKWCHFQ